ncbi:MAG: hypothetical protein HUU38_08410 [Anaerolineales bacterium]|nr:hypothetical protein [Anaerolineales bacterium]
MLYLPLLFHFNQHLSEMAALASQVCYRGLLRTLRANPHTKANLHISGTLLTALKWLDPEPLELIRDGLADGQFELVGSTFAQNIPYATDDWDNAHQIELHRQVLEDTFGVSPTAFWNAERCWRQSLAPIIAAAGYRTITLEDHILEASGGNAAHIYQTRAGDHTLQIVRDDEKLKHLFNFAAWFGDHEPILTYLTECRPPVGEGVLAYAEDAEAMGLWGYFQGVIPHQTWDRLDALLKTLATRQDARPILFSEIPVPSQEITPLADGAATWMNASLTQPGRPYHEDGFKDWFDFNTHSPKLEKFRQFFTEIRRELQAAEKQTAQIGAKKIYQLALHCFLTHQYEFGCIGIGGDQFRGWMGAKAARVLASSVYIATLAKRSGESLQFTIVDDLSKDGIREWMHFHETQLLMASPVGGRLLYWLNLKNGQMLVGNPSAVVRGPYQNHADPPQTVGYPNFWLPDETPYTPYDQTELPPTRLEKFLPEWVWEENPAPVTLAVREMRQAGEQHTLLAQQGAFCDEIWLDGEQVFTRTTHMNAQGAQEAIRFYKSLAPSIGFRKKYILTPHTTTVTYTFTNTSPHPHAIRMTTTSELALDYAALLQHGRAALEFLPDQPGVVNPLTGETLVLISKRPTQEIIRTPALLGLIVGLGFEFTVQPHEPIKFSIQLVRTP